MGRVTSVVIQTGILKYNSSGISGKAIFLYYCLLNSRVYYATLAHVVYKVEATVQIFHNSWGVQLVVDASKIKALDKGSKNYQFSSN